MTASGSYFWIYFNKSKCIKGGRVVLREEAATERWESMEASIRGKEYEREERRPAASPTDKMGKHCYRSLCL